MSASIWLPEPTSIRQRPQCFRRRRQFRRSHARGHVVCAAQLGSASAGNEFQLTWPEDHKGWQLQAQTNSLAAGLGTNWSNVAGSAQTNQMAMSLNVTDGAVFFRLVRL
jgi:hypothetical protein